MILDFPPNGGWHRQPPCLLVEDKSGGWRWLYDTRNTIYEIRTTSDEPEITAGQQLTLHVGVSVREHRIDKYLHGRFRNLSRNYIQDAIKSGGVKVNGKPVKPSFKIAHGDTIEFIVPEPPRKDIPPDEIPLNIIYEDSDIIILNKQANIIIHPTRGNVHGTLVNALMHYSNTLSSGLGEFRPGVVHRLDKNTTGVMVVARNNIAQWKIAKQFELRHVKKTYLAFVHGTPDLNADRIKAPLGVHPQIRTKHAIRPETGKEAITFYEVLEAFRGYSFLKMMPHTGRTHQIRVHLSWIKHPVVGDEMYGGKLVYRYQLADEEPAAEDPIISRYALHAACLEFKHPTTGQEMKFEAPLPQDMQNLLDMLRKYRQS